MRISTFIFLGSTLLTGALLLVVTILLCFMFLQDSPYYPLTLLSALEEFILSIGYKFTLVVSGIGVLFLLQVRLLQRNWEYI
ncbi:hypothetical protein [Thermoflexibacter ruber]|uniref:Uncharacterized protein n=1 Tax=Thermoflexibacter ruber TaxID=1003 RepID=A0A1I2A5X5_9BACT|nr:hypothetical protein [Thermoflexibacter ruber]SFE39236.1 hypothetical protein SAMN04488541_100138 [Thermoflexibacter ruber]